MHPYPFADELLERVWNTTTGTSRKQAEDWLHWGYQATDPLMHYCRSWQFTLLAISHGTNACDRRWAGEFLLVPPMALSWVQMHTFYRLFQQKVSLGSTMPK